MTHSNPYRAYTEGTVLSNDSLDLVVALYEGALGGCRSARLCFEAKDIWGRTKALNKTISILTELMVSLNHEKGGEVAANLKKLYSYMQCCLIEAHTKKALGKIEEVEGLLCTMLDGWKQAAAKFNLRGAHSAGVELGTVPAAHVEAASLADNEMTTTLPYGGYWNDAVEITRGVAYSF